MKVDEHIYQEIQSPIGKALERIHKYLNAKGWNENKNEYWIEARRLFKMWKSKQTQNND